MKLAPLLGGRSASMCAALLLASCASEVQGGGSDGEGGAAATAVEAATSGAESTAATAASSGAGGSGGGASAAGVTLPPETAWARIVEGTLVDETALEPMARASGVDVGADGSVAVVGGDATGSGGAVKSRYLYWDAAGALLHDSATSGSGTEVMNMGATDVSISSAGVVVSGAGFIEGGNPGYFILATDAVGSTSGSILQSVPGGVRDVSTSFGPDARHVVAVAHGGITDFGIRAVNAEPDWEATEPLGEALGAAVGPDGAVVLAGERLDDEDFAGSFLSKWSEGELLWSAVDVLPDFAPAAVAIAADGSIYVAGTTYATPYAATLAAYDRDGTLRWSRDVESVDGFDVIGTAVAMFPDGQILVGGVSGPSLETSGFIRRYDVDGESSWRRDFSSDGSVQETHIELRDVAIGPGGRIGVAGFVGTDFSKPAMFVAALDP